MIAKRSDEGPPNLRHSEYMGGKWSMPEAKMQSMVFDATGKVRVGEVARPVLLEPTDALVRVTLSSICGSDIHMIHSEVLYQSGAPLGHEFVGVIEALGDHDSEFSIGDRVAVSCTIQCGECEFCTSGYPGNCREGGLFGGGVMLGGYDGAQGEYVRVPYIHKTLAKIPDSVSDEAALFVGDILSTGFMAVEKGNLKPGGTVAIFGAGPVGLCTIAAARLYSPSQIIVVDPIESRLEVARAMGATTTINPDKEDAITRILELTSTGSEERLMPVGGVDVAIEAVGISATFISSFMAAKPGGHVSIVGVYTEEQMLPMPTLCLKNLTITMGLVNVTNMPKLLKMIEAGTLDLTPLITHRLNLSEGVKAYEIFEKKLENVIKVALKPHAEESTMA